MPHTTNSSSVRGEAGDEHNPLDSSCFEEVTRVDKVCLGPQIYGKVCCSKRCLPWAKWASHPLFHDEFSCGVWHLMGTWDETMTWKTISFQICQRPKQNWHIDWNKEDLGSSYWVSYISVAVLHNFCTLAFNLIISCFSLTSETHQSQTTRMFLWCIDGGRYISHKYTAALLAAQQVFVSQSPQELQPPQSASRTASTMSRRNHSGSILLPTLFCIPISLWVPLPWHGYTGVGRKKSNFPPVVKQQLPLLCCTSGSTTTTTSASSAISSRLLRSNTAL